MCRMCLPLNNSSSLKKSAGLTLLSLMPVSRSYSSLTTAHIHARTGSPIWNIRQALNSTCARKMTVMLGLENSSHGMRSAGSPNRKVLSMNIHFMNSHSDSFSPVRSRLKKLYSRQNQSAT